MIVAMQQIHPPDLVGFSRLVVDATVGVTGLVEAVHNNIATSETADLVYDSVRVVTRLVGGAIDAILGPVTPALSAGISTPEREAVLAALNGVIGDYLAATDNPLAISMRLRRDGQPLAGPIPQAGGKLAVLVHGLCMNDLQWTRKGHNHGAALARDLGYTPVHLHYNSGVHVSTNGRAFADLMESFLEQWPVQLEELIIVAHSMGGLVARSAYHYGASAGHEWPRRLRKLVFLGTPHHGVPLERVGNFVDTVLDLSRTRPHLLVWARSGAPASPTCATAIWWTKIGTGSIASSIREICGGPCPCRKGCSVTRSPRQPGLSGMASCP
jgi:pimeloyl-ACP methyl ester carboxylesterase